MHNVLTHYTDGILQCTFKSCKYKYVIAHVENETETHLNEQNKKLVFGNREIAQLSFKNGNTGECTFHFNPKPYRITFAFFNHMTDEDKHSFFEKEKQVGIVTFQKDFAGILHSKVTKILE